MGGGSNNSPASKLETCWGFGFLSLTSPPPFGGFEFRRKGGRRSGEEGGGDEGRGRGGGWGTTLPNPNSSAASSPLDCCSTCCTARWHPSIGALNCADVLGHLLQLAQRCISHRRAPRLQCPLWTSRIAPGSFPRPEPMGVPALPETKQGVPRCSFRQSVNCAGSPFMFLIRSALVVELGHRRLVSAFPAIAFDAPCFAPRDDGLLLRHFQQC